MSDRSFTLLELHLHSDGDVQVGPRSLRGDEGETRTATPDGETRTATPDGGTEERSLPLGLLVAGGLGLAAAVAALAWRSMRPR